MNTKQILAETKLVYTNRQSEAKTFANKWEKTGLLDDLTDQDRLNVATLLENQARELVSEASKTGTAEGSEEWSGVALPLVRRIFSEIAAKDFVSVQPMNLPSGLVFWIEFKYGTGQPGFTTGSGKDSQLDSVFGLTETAGEPSEGLYGAGRWGYSINDNVSVALTVGTTPAATVFATASVTEALINYDTAFSASYAGQWGSVGTGKGMVFVTVATASLSNLDLEGVRAFEPSGTGISAYYPQFTYLSSDKTQVSFLVSGSGAFSTDVLVKYHKQPTDITRGDFEDNDGSATDIGIPELNVELRSEPIVAKTRKLKAIWSYEFVQDLNAYHSIDGEAELTSMLSEYVSQELDLEILEMLLQNAITVDYWSAITGREYNAATGAFSNYSTIQAQASAYTQQTWYQTIGTKMQKLSNNIHKKTMRGGANFAVVSPTVATILESIPGYAADTDGNKQQFGFGTQKMGMINNRFQIYKNPYMLENVMLMGFRGNQFLETGAVYAPYVPLIMTPLVYDPNNFTPRKAIMTRYAKKVTRPEFYGKIYIDGLTSV